MLDWTATGRARETGETATLAVAAARFGVAVALALGLIVGTADFAACLRVALGDATSADAVAAVGLICFDACVDCTAREDFCREAVARVGFNSVWDCFSTAVTEREVTASTVVGRREG